MFSAFHVNHVIRVYIFPLRFIVVSNYPILRSNLQVDWMSTSNREEKNKAPHYPNARKLNGSSQCSVPNASLHLAIFDMMLSAEAFQMKTRGFWLWHFK